MEYTEIVQNIFNDFEGLLNHKVEGINAFKSFDRFLCDSFSKSKVFATEFAKLDKTVQEKLLKVFFTFIKFKAKDYESNDFDDRNEYVVVTCYQIMTFLTKNNIELPTFDIDFSYEVEDDFIELNEYIIKLIKNHRACQLNLFFTIREIIVYNDLYNITFSKEIEDIVQKIRSIFG